MDTSEVTSASSPIGRPEGRHAWRKDRWVMRRILMVGRMLAQGYTLEQMFDTVNAWCLENGQPGVTDRQLRTDRDHYYELSAPEVRITAREHVEALQLIKREAFQAWASKSEPAMVRAQMLRVALEAEDKLMKLSGVLVEKPEAVQNPLLTQTLSQERMGSYEYRLAVAQFFAAINGDPIGDCGFVTVRDDDPPITGAAEGTASPGPHE
ncbi:MAG: hypothetical protein ACRENX_02945 [Candidatus Dormibacteria bacterium]